MKTQKHILTGILILVFSLGFSQNGKIKRALSSYDQFRFIKTTEALLEMTDKGHKSVELFEKLGDSYYFNNKMDEAARWYDELMKMNEVIDSEYYFRYAQALKTIGNYDESDKWMQKFNEERTDDLRGKAFVSNIDYLTNIDNVSRDYIEVKNLDINSPLSDFGAIQHKNQLVFASSRGNGKTYEWNEQPFLDLYTAEKESDGNYNKITALNDDINTKYHESSFAYTPDDKFMFFTRNNYYKRKYKKDEGGINRLKIYRAELQKDGSWNDISPIHFNSDEYSVAHSSINAEGTKMYFASDMPGTVGLSDIYMVDINADGTLGKPENLGTQVNTEGQESFPFISENGDLYFSSNGYPGLGGLDVYVIRDFENKHKNKSNNYVVENIGRPINSQKDDFGYNENLGTKEGFFTSNRDGGKGDDDIYSFTIKKCEQSVTGIIKDVNTKELLAGAKVTLLDANGKEVATKTVENDALYNFVLECEQDYLIVAEKDEYLSSKGALTTSNKTKNHQLDLFLEPEVKAAAVGTDLFKLLDLNPIYFDYDKSFIRPDAEIELAKIINYMNEFPNVKVDVRSHTDSRGRDAYNFALSNRRNISTINYIVKVGGVSKDRITGKGYGETKLTNKCSNGVKCTKDEHQANRRSEFIVVAN